MPTSTEDWLRIGALLIGAYVAAVWFALTVWAFRDIAGRSRDPFLRASLPIPVALFGLLGLPLYLLLRPQRTLAEEYERSLEEEALLREMEEEHACPNCKAAVRDDYFLCPVCGTALREPCPRCQRPLHPAWQACPYCGQHLKGSAATTSESRQA